LTDISISVVIPTIGRSSIFDAIESVALQTYPVLEIIIIEDNCDTGNFDSSLKFPIYRYKSTKTGVSNARNIGISKAEGEFIALLDDDDVWIDTKLEKQVKVLLEQKHDRSNFIISSQVIKFTSKNSRISPKTSFKGKNIINELYKLNWKKSKFAFYTPTLLFSKDLAVKLMFNESLIIREDIEFLMRAEKIGAKFIQLNEALCVISYDPIRSWQRETVGSYLKWIRVLSAHSIKIAVSFALGIGIRTLLLKLLSKLSSVLSR